MNTRSLVIMAVLTSFSTFAEEAIQPALSIVGRGQIISNDNKPADSGIKNYSDFNISFLQLKNFGKLNESTSYNISLDATNAGIANDQTSGVSSFVNMAYLTSKFNEKTSLIYGKQLILFGGKESDYSLIDLYTQSAFFLAQPIDNQVGVTLSQDFFAQNFKVEIFNGNKDRTAAVNGVQTSPSAQTRLGWALLYTGSFLDENINPIIGYALLPGITDHNDQRFFSAGIQLNFNYSLVFEADYSEDSIKNGVVSGTDNKIKSIVSLIKHNGEHFKPFIKYISDKENSANGTITTFNKRSAYDVGLEYQPGKDDALRFHLVYSGSTITPFSGVKYSPMEVQLGVKMNATILK